MRSSFIIIINDSRPLHHGIADVAEQVHPESVQSSRGLGARLDGILHRLHGPGPKVQGRRARVPEERRHVFAGALRGVPGPARRVADRRPDPVDRVTQILGHSVHHRIGHGKRTRVRCCIVAADLRAKKTIQLYHILNNNNNNTMSLLLCASIWTGFGNSTRRKPNNN